MQQDYSDVLAVAQSYFEAAYEMNADHFAALFLPRKFNHESWR